jgi:hypothetical protein
MLLRISLAGVAAFLGALLSGCAALPDIGPFVEASAQLRSGVTSSGNAVVAEVRRLKGGEKLANQLATDWTVRVRMCEALARYADSLHSIAKAGAEGRQTANAIADSVLKLANAATITLPAAGVVAIAKETLGFINEQISLARAASALEGSLTAVAPAIDEVTMHVVSNLSLLEKILVDATDASRGNLRRSNNEMIAFRQRVNDQRVVIYNKLNTEGNTNASLARELEEINKLLDATKSLNDMYEKEDADIEKRRNAASALIRASSDAVREWGVAHRQLVEAVKNRTPVNAQSLLEATKEVRDLVKRMREL